jgi:hypothetical protein
MVFTQPLGAQQVCPGAQPGKHPTEMHRPLWQVCPGPHPRPQAPQLFTSTSRLTSQPLRAWLSQSPKPGVHACTRHEDATQLARPLVTVVGQFWKHPPQWALFTLASTQPPEQQVRPPEQAPPTPQRPWQVPPMHTSPAGQWVSLLHCTHTPVPVLHRGVAGLPAQSRSERHGPATQTRVTGSQRLPVGHESGATLHPTHTLSVGSHTGVAGVGAHSRSEMHPTGTSTAASGSGA